MKISWLWLIPIGLIAYVFLAKKGLGLPSGKASPAVSGPAKTTATATPGSPYWKGWDDYTTASDRSTTDNVKVFTEDGIAIAAGAANLFRGVFNSKAAGSAANPTTNGSGSSDLGQNRVNTRDGGVGDGGVYDVQQVEQEPGGVNMDSWSGF